MRLALRQGLEADGYSVSEAGSKVELLERLDGQPTIDLITLDLSLADGDGFGLAREVRARHNIPFIMITGRAEPVARATGLEHGADDYIVKSFHIREALIHIDTVLRRYGKREVSAETGGATKRYVCDAGVLDVQRRSLTAANGEPIALTDAEFDILLIFVRDPGRVLSRDDIMMLLKDRRWSPVDRMFDGHIARRPSNSGTEPITSPAAMMKAQSAIVIGFASTTLTEVAMALAAPTLRLSSSGNETTLKQHCRSISGCDPQAL